MRNLVLILGDQLAQDLSALDGFDPGEDIVWMAEVNDEAAHVWCHKKRLVAFFSAMRHFREELLGRGFQVRYHELTRSRKEDRGKDFASVLAQDVKDLSPAGLVLTEPGDHRVRTSFDQAAKRLSLALEVRADRHFLGTQEAFEDWADGRKTLVLEHFYRHMRKQHDVLVEADGKPVGGTWNLDSENREAFPRGGPGDVPRPRAFAPDAITREVVDMVETRFAKHPGRLEGFDLPVTAEQAASSLRDFLEHRLPRFGRHQDAMWTDEPFLFHSRLSFVLNAHLLDPREALAGAVEALEARQAPLASVEGFVRQVLGWREFVRGVYWREMPAYAEMNELGCADVDVPSFFWDGETDMACLAQAMANVLEHAYAHHIQRLMVLGLYALLVGVHPFRFHEWHMAMYADAVDWVSLPNTLGMSQYGDGGIVGTKPYCASGAYIARMGNYCTSCRYDPKQATGEEACPFTTLYWDFLARHKRRFARNRRMGFQLKNLEKKPAGELRNIRRRAEGIREALGA